MFRAAKRLWLIARCPHDAAGCLVLYLQAAEFTICSDCGRVVHVWHRGRKQGFINADQAIEVGEVEDYDGSRLSME